MTDSREIASALPPSRMSEYRRVKILGEGGFARVYLAVHMPTGRQVALKVSRRARQKEAAGQGQDQVSFSAGHS